MYVCMFFEDFSRLRALAEPKVVLYDRAVDNSLLRYVFSGVLFSAWAWHVIIEIGLKLWSGQLRPQLQVILAQIHRYQN